MSRFKKLTGCQAERPRCNFHKRRFTIVIRKTYDDVKQMQYFLRFVGVVESQAVMIAVGELIRQVVFPDIDKDHGFYECAKSGEKLATVFPDGGSIQVRPADASCKH